MRKGQVAMEYLMIFGLTIAMALPLIIIYMSQSQNLQADITAAQLDKATFEIASAAREVYYMGEPAQKTIEVTFPDGIQSVGVSGSLITFYVDSGEHEYEFIKEVPFNVTGSLKHFEGPHIIVAKAVSGEVELTDT